jgi:hypothetical protein
MGYTAAVYTFSAGFINVVGYISAVGYTAAENAL